MPEIDIKEVVRERYAEAARNVARPALLRRRGLRAPRRRWPASLHQLQSLRRRRNRRVPEEAVLASLGCGNPTALAELREGETVLDLGSGGGIDVLLSARRVGPSGKAYGLDMTDDMLALARENQERRARTMSNSSRAKSSISRCRTIRST